MACHELRLGPRQVGKTVAYGAGDARMQFAARPEATPMRAASASPRRIPSSDSTIARAARIARSVSASWAIG